MTYGRKMASLASPWVDQEDSLSRREGILRIGRCELCRSTGRGTGRSLMIIAKEILTMSLRLMFPVAFPLNVLGTRCGM